LVKGNFGDATPCCLFPERRRYPAGRTAIRAVADFVPGDRQRHSAAQRQGRSLPKTQRKALLTRAAVDLATLPLDPLVDLDVHELPVAVRDDLGRQAQGRDRAERDARRAPRPGTRSGGRTSGGLYEAG